MEKGEWKVLRTYKGSEKLNMFYLCVFRVTGGRRWKSLPGKSRRKGERASGTHSGSCWQSMISEKSARQRLQLGADTFMLAQPMRYIFLAKNADPPGGQNRRSSWKFPIVAPVLPQSIVGGPPVTCLRGIV